MKRVLFFLMITLVAGTVMAQPKARRQQQKQQAQKQQVTTQNQGLSQRARLMYPTSLDMPEDVVWRRDLYREINLNDEANAGLYYPVEPIDRQMNLFTYIFKLALNNYIPVYEYRLDGNESFSDSSRVAMKTLLDNYHIFYETKDDKLRVENSDIPSAEVRMYYLKESAYYDQANAQFRRKVMAICPVMMREDDFGGEAAKYPLFWVKYTDLEPFLSRQSVQASNLNNAATMTLEDYFTMNKPTRVRYTRQATAWDRACPNRSSVTSTPHRQTRQRRRNSRRSRKSFNSSSVACSDIPRSVTPLTLLPRYNRRTRRLPRRARAVVAAAPAR